MAETFGRLSSPAAPITRVMPTVIAGGETMCTPPPPLLVTSAHLACKHPGNPNISKHPMFHSISWPSPGKQHLLMHIAGQAEPQGHYQCRGGFALMHELQATNCWRVVGGAQLVPEQSGQFPHKVSSRACSMDPTNPGLGTPHAQGQTIGDNGH